MAVTEVRNPRLGETTCASLLLQLQQVWDEVGVNDEDRNNVLKEIERECLDVYKRKVDQAVKLRTELLQALADANVELSSLLSALGEKNVGVPEKTSGSIKEEVGAIAPILKQLCKQKEERLKDFSGIQNQIQMIRGEIAGNSSLKDQAPVVDESDLTLAKLEEYQSQLLDLQKEKSERLNKVFEFVSSVHDLCSVLGMDICGTVATVHPSLNDSTGTQPRSISDDTLSRLAKTVAALEEHKKKRIQKLQELAGRLFDLWNLMGTLEEERHLFDHVTWNTSASVNEVTNPGALALDLIKQAETEVERLGHLKFSRMKEIAFKKQEELDDIYARAHIEFNTEAARDKILALIDSGNIEPPELIADMDGQIVKAREEAFSRRDILDKVEKWMSACEEESWLEDYNRDENRYNASRGAHLNLKRAEKTRILVNKIPAMVDTLVLKTRAWEEEHGLTFTYDGVPLLAMLDEYVTLRHEREEEKRRSRDQKKSQEQSNTDQETVVGSKPTPSPARPPGTKKVVGPRANGGPTNGTPGRRQSFSSNGNRSVNKDGKRDPRLVAPVNNGVVSKEDSASCVSGTDPTPSTP